MRTQNLPPQPLEAIMHSEARLFTDEEAWKK